MHVFHVGGQMATPRFLRTCQVPHADYVLLSEDERLARFNERCFAEVGVVSSTSICVLGRFVSGYILNSMSTQ